MARPPFATLRKVSSRAVIDPSIAIKWVAER